MPPSHRYCIDAFRIVQYSSADNEKKTASSILFLRWLYFRLSILCSFLRAIGIIARTCEQFDILALFIADATIYFLTLSRYEINKYVIRYQKMSIGARPHHCLFPMACMMIISDVSI